MRYLESCRRRAQKSAGAGSWSANLAAARAGPMLPAMPAIRSASTPTSVHAEPDRELTRWNARRCRRPGGGAPSQGRQSGHLDAAHAASGIKAGRRDPRSKRILVNPRSRRRWCRHETAGSHMAAEGAPGLGA